MTRREIKKTGSVYTPQILSNFVADKIFQVSNFQKPSVLDPSCGDGNLLKAMKCKIPSATFTGFDLNNDALKKTHEDIGAKTKNIDFLEYVINHSENSLFSEEIEKFDIVIANPPYIRTQVLGEKKAQQIAKDFDLSGRIDAYYAFLEGIHRVLNENGIAGIITSNRFMSVKSGSVIRERLQEHFEILHIWDFGDTKLFSAAVLPAVLLLRKNKAKKLAEPKITTIYSTNEKAEKDCKTIFDSGLENGVIAVDNTNFKIQTGILDTKNDIWKIKTEETNSWQKTVDSHTYMTFGDIGKVRVGIKTTADKVFVKKNWQEPKPELLKPLITHDEARRFKAKKTEYSVLYTHETINGKKVAVDISNFPISEKYLLENKTVLQNRSYIAKTNRNWYEIWVPQQPENWKKTKLVFPDISEKPVFWISKDDEIIQGNCYWIIAENQNDDLLWLAVGVGNSSFIEKFYDLNFNNKLYSGRRRFMTQYVEKFPLPNPESELSKKIAVLSKQIYDLTGKEDTTQMQKELDAFVYTAFGL